MSDTDKDEIIASLREEVCDLQTAVELLATEVAWRRKVGFCPNEAYEAVSNNQTCRTVLSHAECKPVTCSKEDVR